jgi:formylglycine-generating enzyme required for sulfatase activity
MLRQVHRVVLAVLAALGSLSFATARAKYYAASPTDDPAGPDSGQSRVLRGGSWDCWPDGACSANRIRLGPGIRYCTAGFRVARTP